MRNRPYISDFRTEPAMMASRTAALRNNRIHRPSLTTPDQ